jgi:cytochrome P450
VYQVNEHLRQECPVARSDRYGGFWVISRYADIVTALMDPVTFSSAEGVHLPRQEGQQKSIPIDYDPPIHTQYRKIFNDALNMRLIRSREPLIRSMIVQLLAPLAARGGGELVSELAIQLPLQVISGMLGLKVQTTACIRTITEQLWMAFGKERNPAPLRALLALLMNEVNGRRTHPQNDLITQFDTLTIEGRFLTDEELLSILAGFVVAGHETTMNATGNLLLYLAERPQEQAWLRQNPDRIPSIIEESLRYDNPSHLFARTVTRETTMSGVKLKQGDKLVLLYASGNRDSDQFEHPEQFEPQRNPKHHLAFGRGIHLCPGATLARTELRILLEELLNARPPFQLAGSAVWSHMEGGHHMGVARLPVEFLDHAC